MDLQTKCIEANELVPIVPDYDLCAISGSVHTN